MKTLEYWKNRKRHASAKTNAWRLMEDTPESNYWLGYLLSDGCFGLDGRIAFKQEKHNKPAVYKFGKWVLYKGSYKNKCKKTGKEKKSAEARFRDPELCDAYCLKWGIPRGRQENETTKTYVPPDFYHIKNRLVCYESFIAGLISGDGNITNFGASRVKMHRNWLPFLEKIHHEAKLVEVDDHRPKQAMFYLDVKEMQVLYKKIMHHRLPLLFDKWGPVENRYKKHLSTIQ